MLYIILLFPAEMLKYRGNCITCSGLSPLKPKYKKIKLTFVGELYFFNFATPI